MKTLKTKFTHCTCTDHFRTQLLQDSDIVSIHNQDTETGWYTAKEHTQSQHQCLLRRAILPSTLALCISWFTRCIIFGTLIFQLNPVNGQKKIKDPL